jgi:hypothetical protein
MDYDSRRPEHRDRHIAKRLEEAWMMKREGAARGARTFFFL